ncbi:hypothetical protein ES703_70272 [subsurface metagenome]
MTINIIEAFEDKELFGWAVDDQETFQTWKVFLKALQGLPLEPLEFETFKTFTERERQPLGHYDSVYVASGRKSGKSWISAIITCYTALLGPDFWSDSLAPGEKVYFSIISVDKQSARQVLEYIKGILNNNPKFRTRIVNQTAWEIELRNRIVIQIRAANWQTGRAPRYVGCILDEAAFMRDSESAYNAEQLMKSIKPAMIPRSCVYAISSVHGKFGLLYNQYRKFWAKESASHLFWLSDTKSMNPLFSETIIDEAMLEDPVHARAEYFSVWKDRQVQFLPSDAVDKLVAEGRRMIGRIPSKEYRAWIDSSSGMGDAFAMGIGFQDEDKTVIARLEERSGMVPQDVIEEFCAILKEYGISSVSGDKYSIGFVLREFQSHGITYEPSKLSKSEIYLNAGPMILKEQVELLDYPKAINQLKALERRLKGTREFVDHPRGKFHDDLSNVILGVCYLLSTNGDIGPSWAGHGAALKKQIDKEKATEMEGLKTKTVAPHPVWGGKPRQVPEILPEREEEPADDDPNAEWAGYFATGGAGYGRKKSDTRLAK